MYAQHNLGKKLDTGIQNYQNEMFGHFYCEPDLT